MPAWVGKTLLLLFVASLLPLAWIARSRVLPSPLPRVHLVPDMDNQISYGPQQANLLFADRRSMRPPVDGTVARGQLEESDHLYRGIVGDRFATTNPLRLTRSVLERGRGRFEIYCSPCHGLAGYGDGPVAQRAEAARFATWVPPTSMHDELVLGRSDGELFNTITHGIRTMPAYGSPIPVEDRWAIVGYVRALQLSQRVALSEIPDDDRTRLEREVRP